MKIGVRAHDYGRMEIDALAETLYKEGYECIQLAMPKSFPGIESYMDVDLQTIERVRTAFENRKIDIAVLGCYVDLGNPDKEIRENAVKLFKKCLEINKELGAAVVGTETAYACLCGEERDSWHSYMLDSVKRIVDEAVRLDVNMALEPVSWHPLYDLEQVLRVKEAMQGEKHMRFIFDASNVFGSIGEKEQASYWKAWMEGIGKDITAMHIKDFVYDANGQQQATMLGEGIMDYTVIAKWLRENKPEMYLLREEMNPAKAEADIRFMKETFHK